MADYEECERTAGEPTRQRLFQHGVGNLAVALAGQRNTIVCLEKRFWRMTPAGLRNLPGREKQAAPPS